MFGKFSLTHDCAAQPKESAATAEKEEDFQEPSNFMEAIRILRSDDPHYMSITHPSDEVIEDLNSVIKNLRLQLDDGVTGDDGDTTAFELAVALLWHADKIAIQEGILLMEYLLKERWSVRWSTVMNRQGLQHLDGAGPEGQLVESVAEDDDEVANRQEDEEWVDLRDASDAGGAKSSSAAAALARHVPVGTAIRGATAPPPPEDDLDNSVPPSLTRERAVAVTSTSSQLSRCASSTPASAAATATPSTFTTTTNTSTKPTSSSYTSPEEDSAVGDAAASSSFGDSVREAEAAAVVVVRDEELARCYYHLAVGYTKLRKNDKALFFTESVLRLSRHHKDGLRLKRLLSARLYVSRTLIRSIPFFALGLFFL